jgi:hypothetical protein
MTKKLATKAAIVNYKLSINKLFLLLFLAFICSIFMPSTVFAREMIEFPRVKLQSLDKVTARTMTFEAEVGSTLRFGPLYIRVQKCKKTPPIEKPESAAFLQIWEVDPGAEPEWVFSGWMFSSSPALSAMDHPIYDVWVLDCLLDKNAQTTLVPAEEETPIEEESSEANTATEPQETEAQSSNEDAAIDADTSPQ